MSNNSGLDVTRSDVEEQRRARAIFFDYELNARINDSVAKDEVSTEVSKDWETRTDEQKLQVASAIWQCKDNSDSADTIHRQAKPHLDTANTSLKEGRPNLDELETAFEWARQIAMWQRKVCGSFQYLYNVHVQQNVSQTCIDDARKRLSTSWNSMRTTDNLLRQYEEAIDSAETRMDLHENSRPSVNDRKAVPKQVSDTVRQLPRKKAMEAFMKTSLDAELFDGNWEGVRDFGGGLSRAGLWVKYNEYGALIDRIVRKDACLSPLSWLSSEYWKGNPRDLENRQPLEYYLSSQCYHADSDRFVEMRHWVQDHARLALRYYITYCPHGDLAHVMNHYLIRQWVIPEPAVWMVFERLVQCCVIMKRGSYDNPLPDWKEIVHRDLKPENLFLDTATHYTYPMYPNPKMGDFGLAFETDLDDPINPIAYNLGCGTHGYQAPEMLPFIDGQTGEPVDAFKLLDWTNVWGIGTVMHSLINAIPLKSVHQPTYLSNSQLEKPMLPFTRKHYSRKLIDLIRQCIRYDPAQRIKLETLWDDIANEMQKRDTPMGDYMAKARDGTQAPNRMFDLMYPRESYKLGFAPEQKARKT